MKIYESHNPVELHELLFKGKITPTDFTVLAVIESYTSLRRGYKHKTMHLYKFNGCIVTNKNLARAANLNLRIWNKTLKKLIHLKLIKIIGYFFINNEKRRIIATTWSASLEFIDPPTPKECLNGYSKP